MSRPLRIEFPGAVYIEALARDVSKMISGLIEYLQDPVADLGFDFDDWK